MPIARRDDVRGGRYSVLTPSGERVDVELVMVTYRSRQQVEQLLAGLPADLPVVVVDNSDGADGVDELIASRPGSRYLAGGGVGFGRAATAGAASSSADYLVFVNPDTRPGVDDLAALVGDVADDPGLSASAGILLETPDRAQIGIAGWEPTPLRTLVFAAGLHKLVPHAGLYARPRRGEQLQPDWVSGACMAVRRTTFLALGGFDPDFYVYNEDMAFGRASRLAGLRQRLRTDVVVSGEAAGSGAPSLEMLRLRGASMARYLRKYHSGFPAGASIVLLAAGYSARAAAAVARRNLQLAREYREYVLGILTGRATVGGRVVTTR